jgi:hypothetical protein
VKIGSTITEAQADAIVSQPKKGVHQAKKGKAALHMEKK